MLQAPDETDVDAIKDTVTYAQRTISYIDTETVRLRALLMDLRKKRDALYATLVEHKSFVAPIRRLPLEILAEIFSFSLPPRDTPSFDAR